MSNAHYTPFERLSSAGLGNGITESFSYDKRLREQSYSASSGSTVRYSFMVGSFAPNGNVLSVSDAVNGTWSYSYDEMNRLCNANQSSNQPVCHQSALYTYDYDQFGKRWHQNGPQSSRLAFDGNNHITGVTGVGYDASGNLTSDGSGRWHTWKLLHSHRLLRLRRGRAACAQNHFLGRCGLPLRFFGKSFR